MKKRVPPKPEIHVQDPQWKTLGRTLPARIAAAVTRALAESGATGGVTVLLSDDAQVKDLNSQFRGKNKPTNVLSFPSHESPSYLGDIAIAFGVVTREARLAKKAAADHAIHLAIHGTLHLLGHDHEKPRQAARMEKLETEILAEFGIADPYAMPKQPRRRIRAKSHA